MPAGRGGVTGTHGREEGEAIGRSSGDSCHVLPRIGPKSRGFGRNLPVFCAKFGRMEPISSSSGGPAPPAWSSARAPTPPAGGRPGPHDRHERCDRNRTTGTRGATGAAGREGGKANGRFGCHSCHSPSSGGPAPPAWSSARTPTPRPGPHDRHEWQGRHPRRDRQAQSAGPASPARSRGVYTVSARCERAGRCIRAGEGDRPCEHGATAGCRARARPSRASASTPSAPGSRRGARPGAPSSLIYMWMLAYHDTGRRTGRD